jgi:hypothetical protein
MLLEIRFPVDEDNHVKVRVRKRGTGFFCPA